jgi:hypothetical protein
VEKEEWIRGYKEGYERIPEEPALAETSAALLALILPKEEW